MLPGNPHLRMRILQRAAHRNAPSQALHGAPEDRIEHPAVHVHQVQFLDVLMPGEAVFGRLHAGR